MRKLSRGVVAYSNSNPFTTRAVRSGARQGVARRGRRYERFMGAFLARFQRFTWRASCYARKWNGFTAYDFGVGYSRSIAQERRDREDIAHQMNPQDEWPRAISISNSAYVRFRSLTEPQP